ncbi:MAG: hypothetical protein LBT46_05030 [Planctomycetaceae bacterium]|nr:hypothetical protein [Planctomycetaceae bacterium]
MGKHNRRRCLHSNLTNVNLINFFHRFKRFGQHDRGKLFAGDLQRRRGTADGSNLLAAGMPVIPPRKLSFVTQAKIPVPRSTIRCCPSRMN